MILMSLICTCLPLSAGEEAASAAALKKKVEVALGPTPYGVCVESGLQKVFREPSRFAGELKREVHLSLAGNEHEGFQILILPLGGDVKGVHLVFEDLVCPENGAVFKAENFTPFKVGYVPTRPPPLNNTSYQRGDFPVGLWPDPLIPESILDVRQDQGIQPLWIDVYAPAGTPAGLYRGALTVRSWNRGPIRVPVEVRVWDFSLPVQHHLKTAFSFSTASLYQYYMGPGNFDDRVEIPGRVLRKVYDFLLDHRLSPTNIYNPHYRQQFPRREDLEYCIERGLDSFNLGRLVPGSWNTQEGRNYRAYLRDYLAFLEEQGWKDRAYIYGPDEIQYRENYAELKEEHKKAMRELRALDPDVEVLAAIDIDPELHGWVDLWCCLPERWNETLGRQYAQEGEKSWFYWCIGGQRPALLMDFPAIDPRMLVWVCWKYDVEGLLYYWINMWKGREPGDPRPRFPEAPWEFPTPVQGGNGTGLLIYPGPEMGDLFSSIRCENLRDGLEDYEYLFHLRELADQAQQHGLAPERVQKAQELLAIERMVQGPAEFEEDPHVLLDYRTRLAQQIEALQGALRRE